MVSVGIASLLIFLMCLLLIGITYPTDVATMIIAPLFLLGTFCCAVIFVVHLARRNSMWRSLLLTLATIGFLAGVSYGILLLVVAVATRFGLM
jgi:hypothetical protein